MKTSVFDMDLLKNSWSTKEMREIFCEHSRIQAWLDTEAALAKAQAKLNIIPKEAALEIEKKSNVESLDMDFIMAEFAKTKHPLVPTIRGLEKACDNNHGEFVHFGVTTQDIIDTGLVLQFKQGLQLIKKDLKNIAQLLKNLAKEHKDTVMMGRTLSLQALPITFGHKVAIWLSELCRQYDRVLECEKRLYVGSIVGAVGTKASLSEHCDEVEELTLKYLGLNAPDISWQPSRDRFIELGFVLGNINATFNKIAHQILLLAHNEIDELNEPFSKGQVGSSTMPHKRNPAISENAVTVSNALKSNLAIMSDIARHEHERDGQVWKMEWKLLPESFLMLSVVLKNMKEALDGLVVKKEQMLRNCNALKGFVMAERVMFALSDRYGKQDAHEIVYEVAMKGIEANIGFKEALLADKRVSDELNNDQIEALMDASSYIGYAPRLVEKFLRTTQNASIFKQE